jgi:hypothetical protein
MRLIQSEKKLIPSSGINCKFSNWFLRLAVIEKALPASTSEMLVIIKYKIN